MRIYTLFVNCLHFMTWVCCLEKKTSQTMLSRSSPNHIYTKKKKHIYPTYSHNIYILFRPFISSLKTHTHAHRYISTNIFFTDAIKKIIYYTKFNTTNLIIRNISFLSTSAWGEEKKIISV